MPTGKALIHPLEKLCQTQNRTFRLNNGFIEMFGKLSPRLDELKGKALTIACDEDGVRIKAADGWSLTIYNKFKFQNGGGAEHGDAIPARPRVELIDYSVDHGELILTFTENHVLAVDVTDDGYRGPEAMQLHGPDGTIMIWN